MAALQGAFGQKAGAALNKEEMERLKRCVAAISSGQPRHAWEQAALSNAPAQTALDAKILSRLNRTVILPYKSGCRINSKEQ